MFSTRLVRSALLAAQIAVAASFAGCGDAPVQVKDQVAVVGCGMHVFGMQGGCYWAVQLDGKDYWVQGVDPEDTVTAHKPGGMCTTSRRALVSGSIDHGKFVATQFELLPLDGTEKKVVNPGPPH